MKKVRVLTASFHNDAYVQAGTILDVPDDFKCGFNMQPVDENPREPVLGPKEPEPRIEPKSMKVDGDSDPVPVEVVKQPEPVAPQPVTRPFDAPDGTAHRDLDPSRL